MTNEEKRRFKEISSVIGKSHVVKGCVYPCVKREVVAQILELMSVYNCPQAGAEVSRGHSLQGHEDHLISMALV